jgi:hypothetical protein
MRASRSAFSRTSSSMWVNRPNASARLVDSLAAVTASMPASFVTGRDALPSSIIRMTLVLAMRVSVSSVLSPRLKVDREESHPPPFAHVL